jgi:D-alanyl-D-alanine dipeptidase
MICLDSNNTLFKVEPFWKDEPYKTDDPELQKMLDSEGAAFRRYITQNPNYKMMVRMSVLDRLNNVQKMLPSHLSLVLKAGHRPLSVQLGLFTETMSSFKTKFPKASQDELYKMTLECVADPDNFIPPHSTGGAVDIFLFDNNTQKPVDMGSPINFPDDRSWTFTNQISETAKENRLFLLNIMIDNGFANLASEWWHFSYGDQYWALFYDKNECLYSSVDE